MKGAGFLELLGYGNDGCFFFGSFLKCQGVGEWGDLGEPDTGVALPSYLGEANARCGVKRYEERTGAGLATFARHDAPIVDARKSLDTRNLVRPPEIQECNYRLAERSGDHRTLRVNVAAILSSFACKSGYEVRKRTSEVCIWNY